MVNEIISIFMGQNLLHTLLEIIQANNPPWFSVIAFTESVSSGNWKKCSVYQGCHRNSEEVCKLILYLQSDFISSLQLFNKHLTVE